MEKKVVGALAGAGILLNVFAFRLPVVQDVDVVVAGGSSAAVAAAVAAKQAGATVMEMMAHDVNGKTEVFRGCPEEWKDVSFENIVLSDGRRASGRRVNGKADIVIH